MQIEQPLSAGQPTYVHSVCAGGSAVPAVGPPASVAAVPWAAPGGLVAMATLERGSSLCLRVGLMPLGCSGDPRVRARTHGTLTRTGIATMTYTQRLNP